MLARPWPWIMILGEGRKKDTHKERAAAEHPEGDVIIPIKSWTHLALPAASRQRNSSEAGGGGARHASTCTSCKGLMRKKRKLAAGGDLSKRPPPAAHATFDDGQARPLLTRSPPCLATHTALTASPGVSGKGQRLIN